MAWCIIGRNMPDPTLVMLLDEVRGRTLGVLKGASDAQARFAPPGLHNTILWHAGHAYFLLEALTDRAVAHGAVFPTGWEGLFTWESRPADVPPDRWPPIVAVERELEEQHRRMRAIFTGLTAEQLASRAVAMRGRTVRYVLLHALHDEACHSGEMWLLRKMQAASRE